MAPTGEPVTSGAPIDHGNRREERDRVPVMRNVRRGLRIGAVSVSLLMAVSCVAACSGSSTDKSGGAPAGTSGTSGGGSKAPIVIGNIGTYSGVGSSSQGGYRQGLQAWMNATNAAGGINGHPIKLITVDDAGNPTTALTEVQKMVTNDHIVALLSPASATTAYMSYLSGKGIPAITASGFYGISPGLTLNASTSLLAFSKAEATLAKLSGKTSYADIYCAEVTVCKSSDVSQKAEAEKLGMKFVSFAQAASASSYTAACLQLKAAGIQAVALNGFTDMDLRFAKDCVQQGYHPLWLTVGTALTPAFLSTPALSGLQAALLDFPWFEADSPATNAFQAALTKYLPDIKSDALNYSPNLSAAYAAGMVFTKAATSAPDPTNVKDLLGGLAKITADDFGGLTPPLTFGTPDLLSNPSKYVQPQANCFFAIENQNGAWGKVTGQTTYSACVKD